VELLLKRSLLGIYSTFLYRIIYWKFNDNLQQGIRMSLYAKNQGSLVRVTEIIDFLLKEILKEVSFRVLCGLGRLLFKWSKPSLIEYKNRAELVYHFSLCELKIESPLKFLIIYLKYRGKNINQPLS
jgi:hypothetical protein